MGEVKRCLQPIHIFCLSIGRKSRVFEAEEHFWVLVNACVAFNPLLREPLGRSVINALLGGGILGEGEAERWAEELKKAVASDAVLTSDEED